MRAAEGDVKKAVRPLPFTPRPSTFSSVRVKRQAGEIGGNPGAEGATAPETLRQKDRRVLELWRADGLIPVSPKEQVWPCRSDGLDENSQVL